MPLPTDPKQEWPPRVHRAAFDLMDVHDAWYVGDVDRLAGHYTTPANGVRSNGVVGTVRRWFWGDPNAARQPRSRVHAPLASDLASTSAALLFSEPVTVSAPDGQGNDAAAARLDLIVNTPLMHSRLLEAAEVSAALSGVWLRCVWDADVADHVMVDVVDADRAVGEWQWGHLTAVTFWTEYRGGTGDSRVWRHLERHEPGRILHALYQGTARELGITVPLQDREETSALANQVDADQAIVTGVKGLTAGYVPNVRPNRRFRKDPALAELGRSDLDGIEPLMDGLDETWTSLQRDLRLGKGRIVVPDSMLTDLGPGRGAAFDEDREVFSSVKVLAEGNIGQVALASQFDIRVQEHLQTAEGYVREAIKAAGYSPLTFGLPDEVAATATEIDARERATQQTRAAKIRYWQATLGPFLRTLLEVDALVFRTGAEVGEALDVAFPAAAKEPLQVRAQTVALLFQAQSASTLERVRILHPEWDAKQVADEVDLIDGANAVPDPAEVLPPAADPAVEAAPEPPAPVPPAA